MILPSTVKVLINRGQNMKQFSKSILNYFATCTEACFNFWKKTYYKWREVLIIATNNKATTEKATIKTATMEEITNKAPQKKTTEKTTAKEATKKSTNKKATKKKTIKKTSKKNVKK